MPKGDAPRSNREVGEQLRSLFDRIGRIDEEIANSKLDRKDVLMEAKSLGFDDKIMTRVMRLRKMERGARFEERAMEEVYLAALGEGDGALSDAARQFLAGRRGDDLDRDDDDQDGGGIPSIGDGKAPDKPGVDPNFGDVSDKPVVITVEDARKLGAAAAQAGKPVTSNPFPAGDDRRAAWDEAWCGSLGSDGMDIPPELRASKKGGKDDPKPDGKPGDDKKGNDK